MDIGKNIKHFRKINKLTMVELSNLTGLSQSYISEVERNIKTPSLDALFKIAEALNTSVASLIDSSDTPLELKELIENAKDLKPEQIRKLNELIETFKTLS